MGTKINLRMITKNHAADPEIGFFIKSILKAYGLTSQCRQRASKEVFSNLNNMKKYAVFQNIFLKILTLTARESFLDQFASFSPF